MVISYEHDELKSNIPPKYRQVTDILFMIAEKNDLTAKNEITRNGKRFKVMFSVKKPKRLIFSFALFKDDFFVKANLYGIDSYLKDFDLTKNIINQLQNNSWECERYSSGKDCNSKCRGGVPLTINGSNYRKCVGGAFTFRDLSDYEWEQIGKLIEMELCI